MFNISNLPVFSSAENNFTQKSLSVAIVAVADKKETSKFVYKIQRRTKQTKNGIGERNVTSELPRKRTREKNHVTHDLSLYQLKYIH